MEGVGGHRAGSRVVGDGVGIREVCAFSGDRRKGCMRVKSTGTFDCAQSRNGRCIFV